MFKTHQNVLQMTQIQNARWQMLGGVKLYTMSVTVPLCTAKAGQINLFSMWMHWPPQYVPLYGVCTIHVIIIPPPPFSLTGWWCYTNGSQPQTRKYNCSPQAVWQCRTVFLRSWYFCWKLENLTPSQRKPRFLGLTFKFRVSTLTGHSPYWLGYKYLPD